MYRFLHAEMVKSDITISKLANQIGVTDFTWKEAVKERKIVLPKMGLEELFQTDGEEVEKHE